MDLGATSSPKSQADTVKPIKMKAKAADVKRFAQIMPPDDSVHTLQATKQNCAKCTQARGAMRGTKKPMSRA